MANKYIRDLTPWPANLPLPTDGRPFFYDPATDREYTFTPGQLAAGAGGRARATAWVFAQRIEQYELKSNSLGRVFFALNLILSPVNEPFLPTSAAADNALYQLVGPDDALTARVTADETALTAHTANQTNPHAVTAAQLPDFTTAARALFSAGNVLTYSTATGAFTLPAATATQAGYLSAADFTSFSQKQAALGYVAENAANKGAANGYAPLDGGRLIPAVFLPSYVDDIEEYATLSAFPAVGQTGKIYLATNDLDGQWRWSTASSSYRKFNSSIGTTDNLVEGSVNQYFTSTRVLATTIAGYAKAAANAALVAGDTLLLAVGKLERKADDNTANVVNNAARLTQVEAIAKAGTGQDSGRIGGANITNSGARSGSAGGYLNTNSGAESGSVGGGGNTNSGPDCASIGGAQNVNSGDCCTSQGGLRNNNKGKYSSSIGGQDNTNSGDYGTMDNCRACNIPRSCTFVRLSQCSGFTPPEGTNFTTYVGNQRVFPDTSTPIGVLFAAPTNLAVDASRNVTFTPASNQTITAYEYSYTNVAWVAIPAGTLTLPAGTGVLAVRLALVGSGLPGTAAILSVPAAGGATATAPTITNPTFTGDTNPPTITNPTFSAS